MKIEKSNIVSAFSTSTVGSKVVDPKGFMAALKKAVGTHDRSKDRVKGQHYILIPKSAWTTVSAGVGRKTTNPEDYVVRLHRGQPTLYLRREHAAEVEGLACVVYTREAYLSNQDIQNDLPEKERIEGSDCSHVMVAVLASAGPRSPLTPYRLVHNLAGGNKEATTWSADEIRSKACESKKYWDEWAVVAD